MKLWLTPPKCLLLVVILVTALVGFSFYFRSFWFPCKPYDEDCLAIIPVHNNSTGSPSMTSVGSFTSNSTKRILFWSSFYGMPDYEFGLGQQAFARCPVRDCETTTNRSLLNDSDAVVFHPLDTNLRDLPRWRSASQRWVFYLLESPSLTYVDLRPFGGLFNWTMTYRSDSDIVAAYGYVIPLAQRKYPATGRAMANRTLNLDSAKNSTLASWLVSNCRTASHREDYVKELRRYMPIDVYGKCGGHPCEKGPRCGKKVYGGYKFYLSFENSVCREYVSEKFFKVLHYDTVPVVYGGAEYKTVAPPHSYIDVLDFATPRHLADHLKMLDKNDTLYRQYFLWKTKYRVVIDYPSFCKLCAKLHSATARDTKTYEDMHDWWVTKGTCANKLVKLDYSVSIGQ